MNVIAIIPARMGSSRFPGKPLAPLHGVPMLGHVYLRTQRNAMLSGVYIATCDDEIRTYATVHRRGVRHDVQRTHSRLRSHRGSGRLHRAQGPAGSTPSSWFRETSRCWSRR